MILSLSIISYGMYQLLHQHASTQKIALPKPAGEFNIGFTNLDLVDITRKEVYSEDPLHKHRELVIDAWYPVNKNTSGVRVDFFGPLSTFVKNDISRLENQPISLFAHFDALKSHALFNMPLSDKYASYPVIIFSPGFGSPARLYTSLCEELASQGYIVFALNYPYITSPVIFHDGRVIAPTKKFEQFKGDKEKKDQATLEEMETWIKDMRFLVDQLAVINKNDKFSGKLNLNKIGVCGHSLGGAAAINMSRNDDRIKACCNLDGRLRGVDAEVGFSTPLMVVLSDRQDLSSQKETQSINRLISHMTNDAYMLMIKATNHGSFTDFDYLVGKSTEDTFLKFYMIRSIIARFFDVYLHEQNKNLILDYVKDHSEIQPLKIK